MSWDPRRYPADWKDVVTRVRERAGNCCEADGCAVPNHVWIHRAVDDADVYEQCLSELGWDCTGRDVDEVFPGEMKERPTYVVLTTAHLCSCEPKCGILDHLRSLCQLHHLRLDRPLHLRHAAENRRKRRLAAGQGALL